VVAKLPAYLILGKNFFICIIKLDEIMLVLKYTVWLTKFEMNAKLWFLNVWALKFLQYNFFCSYKRGEDHNILINFYYRNVNYILEKAVQLHCTNFRLLIRLYNYISHYFRGGLGGGALGAEVPPSKFYYMSKVESF